MMSLSTRGRYAARIMVFLARNRAQQPVTKFAIGEAEEISPNYIEQIMVRLKSAHLVRSHRGRHGGFSLTRHPDRITLADVLRAVEGPVCPVPCLYDTCTREANCPTRPVWRKAAEAVEEVFSGTTLGDMARHESCGAPAVGHYQI